jgi:hypothetical protein
MMRLLTVLYRPTATIHELRARPAWFSAFLVLAAISVVIFMLQYPGLLRATLDHLPSVATDQDRSRAEQWMRTDMVRRAAFLPARLLAGWSAFALLLLAGARAFGPARGVRYAHLLSLEIHAESVLALGAALAAAHAPGAGWLFSPGFGGSSLLTSVNLFTLWYVSLLIRGISVLCDTSPRKAFLIVVLSWGIGQALNFGVLSLLQHTFRLG